MINLSEVFGTGYDVNITGLTADSRKVKPGFAFFAIKGAQTDGHDYIDKAIAAGTSIIVGEKDLNPEGAIYIKSRNTRKDLAHLAAKFYPEKPKNIVVITGTNGKTSIADFTRQLWKLAGFDAASIGTLGFVSEKESFSFEADNTTPDPVTLNELLTKVKDCAIIEGSSIGLEQNRLDFIPVKAAGFTNFTRDHIDYHNTMEEYFRTKTLLFIEVMKNGTAVLNSDIPEFETLKTLSHKHGHEILSYGKNGEIKLLEAIPSHDGQTIRIEIFGEGSEHKLPLVGSFQAYNVLCAIGLVLACGMDTRKLRPLIDQLVSIPGRMEQAAPGVYVDYAHTPDALENALTSLRPHVTGRLFVVFGCGGDRDKGKRPEMGAIANKLADYIIVTDDNPRTEGPEQIRREIMAQCPGAVEIANRAEAINHAMTEMKQGDILLVAGKGHEKYQIYGKEKKHFDDVEVAKKFKRT